MEATQVIPVSFARVVPDSVAALFVLPRVTQMSMTCVKSSSRMSMSVNVSASSLSNFTYSCCSSSKTPPVKTRQLHSSAYYEHFELCYPCANCGYENLVTVAFPSAATLAGLEDCFQAAQCYLLSG